MKFIDNILYLEYKELVNDPEQDTNGPIPVTTYRNWRTRDTVVFKGTGGNGRTVYIRYDSLPPHYEKLVLDHFKCDEIYEYASLQPLRDLINRIDVKAIEFFDRYTKPNGDFLEDRLKREYVKAAGVMRMIDYVYDNKKWLKKDLKIELTKFWDVVGSMPEVKAAGLPTSARKLRPRHDAWKKDSYASLVSGKIGNTNRLKADDNMINLILSLYTDVNKPYALDVYDYYKQFISGKVHLVDQEGELYNPADFDDVCKTTVWNIIDKNRVIADKLRISNKEFNDRHRPYNSRFSPIYAFSKLTMDDRSIPFKLEDNKRIWAYYIGDVASQCIVGRAFSRSNDEGSGKDRALFKASMMDMFRLIIRNGWGMPAEIEVEHHISNTFIGKTREDGTIEPDLLTDNFIFPIVTWCNPANPQQKRAEHIFRGMKYQKEKGLKGFIGRFYSRLDSNRVNPDKKLYKYTFEELQAEMEYAINDWNNDLHPNQTIYPGLTRWQVLEQHQNPDLVKPHLPTIVKYIGQHTTSSINRTECKAFNDTYVVPVSKGFLNGTIVTAYSFPSDNIKEVYLYQEDKYIATAIKKGRYNESKAERTEEDERIRKEQSAHTAQFDIAVKKRVASLKKIKVVEAEGKQLTVDRCQMTEVENPVAAMADMDEYDANYWTEKALEDL